MRTESNSKSAHKALPPLFIMGCPRSGTTLVSQILDSHSRIAVYHETHYFPVFRPDLHRYGNLGRPSNLRRLIQDIFETIRAQGLVEPPAVEEIIESLIEPTFEGVLSTLLHVHARRQGKARGGDKTPDHFRYLEEILEKFPDSPIIFVMRDPRDTILSFKRTFGTTNRTALLMWNAAFMSYWGSRDSVHLVRYEELAQNPAETVKAICDFIGEPYEADMLRFFERTPETVRALPKVGKLVRPVDSGSVGNFQRMPPQEIEQIEYACAYGMEAMGYSFTTSAARSSGTSEITTETTRARKSVSPTP